MPVRDSEHTSKLATYSHSPGGQYIRILRMLEKHPLPVLRAAVEKALHAGAIRRDAIAQFILPQEEWRATLFPLDGHPHLRGVKVQAPDVRQYGELLAGGGR